MEDAIGLGGKLGSWVSIETVGHAATAPGTTLVHRMIHFKTKDLPASPAGQTIPQSGRPCPEGHKSLRKRLWSVSSHCVPRMELADVCVGGLVCPHTYQKKRPMSSLGHSIIEQAGSETMSQHQVWESKYLLQAPPLLSGETGGKA